MRSSTHVAIGPLLPRALILWGLIRLVFAALPLASGVIGASISPSPPGVVGLTGLVGLIDIRVRSETILRANLGVSRWTTCALYAAAAVLGECVLAVILA
jgi:hypothetical protein